MKILHTNCAEFSSISMKDSILTIPVLPEELITEILSRLPVKSLLRFKLASKFWLSLISSPEFIKTHLRVSTDNKDCAHHRLMMKSNRANNNLKDCSFSSLLYDESIIETNDLNCPMENSGASFCIVGSVNGLICLAGETGEFFLWNPTIKKYKKLSHSTRRLTINYTNIVYGFGYDEFRDDYKVVCIVYHFDSLSTIEVKIYSLKSDSWRNMNDFGVWISSEGSGTFCNGKLHWTTSWALGKYGRRRTWRIISIDIADERWGKVEPPCVGEKDASFKLGVLGNNLSGLSIERRLSGVNMWVMEEYGVKESWTKMYTIKCLDDIARYLFSSSYYMSNKGEILVVFRAPRMIQNQEDTPPVIKKIYKSKDDSIRYAEVTNFGTRVSKEIYIESLVCPLSRNQQGLINNEGCRSVDE